MKNIENMGVYRRAKKLAIESARKAIFENDFKSRLNVEQLAYIFEFSGKDLLQRIEKEPPEFIDILHDIPVERFFALFGNKTLISY